MSRRILVTGAHGFIGRRVVRVLESQGCHVVRAVRTRKDETDIEMNLNDPASVLNLQRLEPTEAIIHLAAQVDLKTAALEDFFMPNTLATANLSAVARQWKAHLVFASSVAVAGAKRETITDTDPPDPDTPYGRSKYLAEQLIQASGVGCSILRLAGVFGIGGPSHLGLNVAIAACLRGERPVLSGEGTMRRNYLYVEDAALLLTRAACEKIGGVHYLAGSEILTIRDALQTLCDLLLPGTAPTVRPGTGGRDQIIVPSKILSAGRGFRDSVVDIQQKVKQGCLSAC